MFKKITVTQVSKQGAWIIPGKKQNNDNQNGQILVKTDKLWSKIVTKCIMNICWVYITHII